MSLAHKILKNSIWLYIGQWINRLIGFISTIILARILTPDDFGIVASISIVTAVFHVISATGAKKYLLRKKFISDVELNTAWTVEIALKFIIFLGIYLSAKWVSDFFDEPRLLEVLEIASVIPLVRAFANIGMLNFEKEMNYKPGFYLNISTQILAFTIKLTLAIIYESYWAFIIAELIATLFSTMGSYYFSSYRPKFSLNAVKEQWEFSKWVLAKGFFSTIRFKIDNILIAKYFSTPVLGSYTVAKDLATIPAGQIVKPIMEPIYVGLAKDIKSPIKFADKVHKILLSIAIIVMPISIGTMSIADDLTMVVLGEGWQHAIPILEVITLVILSGAINDFCSTSLTVLGKVKAAFMLDVIFGVATITLFVWLVSSLSIVQFAWLRVGFGYSVAVLTLIYINMISSVRLLRIAFLFIVPALLSSLMFISIFYFNYHFQLNNRFIGLMFQIFIGVFVYAIGLTFTSLLLKSKVAEFSFIWKTFFIPIANKIIRNKV